MGCDYYPLEIEKQYYDDTFIRFSEMDDTFGCLCTFPWNNQENMDIDTLRSLALLGAGVVLAYHNEIDTPVFLPYGIPDWIIKGIDKYLPEEKDE